MAEIVDNIERRKLLSVLSDDLGAQPWDQANRLWFVMGEPEDEYLEFVGEFRLDPDHWMMHRADEGVLRDSVAGVVVSYESWTYPKAVRQVFVEQEDDTPEEDNEDSIFRAYRSCLPPHRHPSHLSVRTVVLVGRDGLVMRAERFSEDGETNIAALQGVDPTGPVGDPLIDFSRALLGISIGPNVQHAMGKILSESGRMEEILSTATSEGWSTKRMAVEIYGLATPEQQAELMEHMSDDFKEAILNDDIDT